MLYWFLLFSTHFFFSFLSLSIALVKFIFIAEIFWITIIASKEREKDASKAKADKKNERKTQRMLEMKAKRMGLSSSNN